MANCENWNCEWRQRALDAEAKLKVAIEDAAKAEAEVRDLEARALELRVALANRG